MRLSLNALIIYQIIIKKSSIFNYFLENFFIFPF
jgi:hypothetical protein